MNGDNGRWEEPSPLQRLLQEREPSWSCKRWQVPRTPTFYVIRQVMLWSVIWTGMMIWAAILASIMTDKDDYYKNVNTGHFLKLMGIGAALTWPLLVLLCAALLYWQLLPKNSHTNNQLLRRTHTGQALWLKYQFNSQMLQASFVVTPLMKKRVFDADYRYAIEGFFFAAAFIANAFGPWIADTIFGEWFAVLADFNDKEALQYGVTGALVSGGNFAIMLMIYQYIVDANSATLHEYTIPHTREGIGIFRLMNTLFGIAAAIANVTLTCAIFNGIYDQRGQVGWQSFVMLASIIAYSGFKYHVRQSCQVGKNPDAVVDVVLGNMHDQEAQFVEGNETELRSALISAEISGQQMVSYQSPPVVMTAVGPQPGQQPATHQADSRRDVGSPPPDSSAGGDTMLQRWASSGHSTRASSTDSASGGSSCTSSRGGCGSVDSVGSAGGFWVYSSRGGRTGSQQYGRGGVGR